MNRILIGIIVILLIIIGVGYIWFDNKLEAQNDKPQDNIIATINDEALTEAEFVEELKRIYGKEVLDEMINNRVITLASKKYGVKASEGEIIRQYNEFKEGYDTEEDFTEFLKEQMGITKEQLLKDIEKYILWEEIATKDVELSEEQVKNYYEKNQNQYKEPEEFHIQQILLKTEVEANQVVSEISNGSDFNTIAKERSIDIFTVGSGGDLGFISENDFSVDPSIIIKARTLEINEISIVVVEEGYAVIRVIDHKDEVQYPLEEVKDEIRRDMALSQVDSLPEILYQLKIDMNVQVLDPSFE